MGDCGSRPTSREIEQHVQQNNTANDAFFTSLPYVDKEIENETNLNILESKKKFYRKKNADYSRQFSATPRGFPPIPELNIEIQKGLYIDEATSCMNRGHPYVVVRLEPNGPTQETFVGNAFKPSWFKLIQFKLNNFNYHSLVVTLMVSKQLGGSLELGSVTFHVKDLRDQALREDWFEVPTAAKGTRAPKLRLRVQLLHDLRMLYEDLQAVCDQKIELIERVCLDLASDPESPS